VLYRQVTLTLDTINASIRPTDFILASSPGRTKRKRLARLEEELRGVSDEQVLGVLASVGEPSASGDVRSSLFRALSSGDIDYLLPLLAAQSVRDLRASKRSSVEFPMRRYAKY
jgi:hypothetical protein